MSHKLNRVDRERPGTPLGELANEMFDVAGENIKAIVMLRDDETGEYITAHHGYDDDASPVVDLLIHIQAASAASGLRLDFLTVDEDGATKVAGFDPEEE